MIDKASSFKDKLQETLAKFPENFTGLGRLKNHKVKMYVNADVKPVRVPTQSFPYHLEERAKAALQSMIDEDGMEEHQANEPSPWISNLRLVEKPDEGLCVTVDAHQVNKALQSTNLPIPR